MLFSRSNHSFQHAFHKFSTIEEFSTKDGDSHVLAKLCQQGQNAAVPFCGTERPLDWFIEIDKPTGDKRCWKCRELKKGEGNDRIG